MPPTSTTPRTDNVETELLVGHEPSDDIVDYYRQTIEDYQLWSPEGYMHFGLWRPGINPFNRRAMLEAMNDLVFQQLGLEGAPDQRVGDFGCGVGAVSRHGCRRFPDHHWNAVTICDKQVAYGTSLLNNAERLHVSIDQADFCDLPYADETFDAVFFLESLCHAHDAVEVLTECRRVLKPGGKLVVVDGLMKHRPEDTPDYARRLSKTVANNWAVNEFHSLPVFEEAITAAGLVLEEKQELGWQITPCVAHSPLLITWHSLQLIATGRWTAWKRKHMIACALGVLLGSLRHQFGYYMHCIKKPAGIPTGHANDDQRGN